MPAGGSRKHHTKRRTGCKRCKKRRVRCDGIGPRCSNCRRRDEICDFGLLPARSHRLPSDCQHQELVVFDPVPEPASPNLEVLELLHHYQTAIAYMTIPKDDNAMLHVWQHDLPLAAQSHDFLTDGILALAALHKAHMYPSAHSNYHSLAIKYQIQGSQKFRGVVDRINNTNSTAVFGFSIIVAISQFQYCVGLEYSTPKLGIDAIISAVVTLRGSFALAINHDTLFKNSSFGILPKRSAKWKSNFLDSNTEQALAALDAMNMSSETSTEDKLVCTSTIECLRRWYSVVTAYPESWDMVLRWPIITSSQYIELLQKRDPMALSILAYWCVPIHRTNPRWFIEGWAEITVRIIAAVVPLPWREAMRWPIDEMKLQNVYSG